MKKPDQRPVNPRHPATAGAVVEIVEANATSTSVILPNRVKVNGTDVGCIQSVTVDLGDGEAQLATVTLTLLPSRVEIKAIPRPDEPEPGPAEGA